MILKAAKAFGYMFRSMILFMLRKMFYPSGLDRVLEKDYLNWGRYVLRVFDTELAVEGRENIPPLDGRRLIVVSNHQSQLDIPTLVTVLDRRLGFVAKKELASIPLLNYWMREIGCVVIDRSDKSGSHRALEKAAKGMGIHPLVVFPEGTRSKDGKFLPIKLGGFRLALLAGARVLPILIEGTRDAAESRAKGVSGPIPVKVRVYPALDTLGMDDGKASLNRLKDYVDACWRSKDSHEQTGSPITDARPR